MKKVFTHENRLIAYNIKNLLEEQGIHCVIKNEFAGGGVGDLAPFETWPEVWITDLEQATLAKELIGQVEELKTGESWTCQSCGETNDHNFQLCWSCGSARQSSVIDG